MCTGNRTEGSNPSLSAKEAVFSEENGFFRFVGVKCRDAHKATAGNGGHTDRLADVEGGRAEHLDAGLVAKTRSRSGTRPAKPAGVRRSPGLCCKRLSDDSEFSFS